jgi:hypothetical protein
MAARDQLGQALFGLAMRNFTRGGRAKKLRVQAGESLIALKLPRARPPSGRLAARGIRATLAAATVHAETVALQHPMSRFADDMNELLQASRARRHSEWAKAAQEARIRGVREMAGDPQVWNLGLRDEQAGTLGALLGHLWGAPFHGGARSTSQVAAQELSEGLRTVWERALPPGMTLKQTLEAAWHKLEVARRADPELAAGDFLREALFKPWRSRFMNQLPKEVDLCTRLQLATGLKVVQSGATDAPRFLLELQAGKVPFRVGLDIDHAEQRLAEAVEQALAQGSAAPLKTIVQGSSLQLAMPAENRVVLEFLRRRNRVAEQMRSSSASLMATDDQAELMAALERELQALDAWLPWSPPQ